MTIVGKEKMTMPNRNILKNDNSEKEKSEKGQFRTGQI